MDVADVGRIARPDIQVLRADQEAVDVLARRPVVEVEADPAPVDGRPAAQLVVDFDHDVTARRQPQADSLGERVRVRSRSPSADPVGQLVGVVVRHERAGPEDGEPGLVVLCVLPSRPAAVVGEEVGVVNHRVVARLKVDGRNGPIPLEPGRNDEVAVDVVPLGGDLERLDHLQHQVRLPVAPPGIGQPGLWRTVTRQPLGCVARRPLAEELDLGV